VRAVPAEGGDPGTIAVGRPGFVVEQGDQAAAAFAQADVERRADEPDPADAEPAAGDLQPVVSRPLEVVDLEREVGERIGRCDWLSHGVQSWHAA
jgi:hypothetical protein